MFISLTLGLLLCLFHSTIILTHACCLPHVPEHTVCMMAAASVTNLRKDQGKGRVEALNMVETEALMFQEDHDEENGEVTPGKASPEYSQALIFTG